MLSLSLKYLINLSFLSNKMISQMYFRVSHIFQKGNKVTDILANYGTLSSEFVWWDESSHFLLVYYNSDVVDLP